MRVLSIHNFYRSNQPSGENLVVERERKLMRDAGWEFGVLDRHSDTLLNSKWKMLQTAFHLGPNVRRQQQFRDLLQPYRQQTDILHAHNLWPLFTYDLAVAAKDLDFKVINTLHNYRLIASDSHFLGKEGARKPAGKAEAEHLKRMPAIHGGWLRNHLYTKALAKFWQQGILDRAVDVFVCLTDFQRKVMHESGIPSERLVVKPNFIPDLDSIKPNLDPGDYVLFVGRLKAEKGIDRLCSLWPQTGLPLKVVGDGPLAGQLPKHPRIEYCGSQPFAEVLKLMAGARFVIHTSIWYETFGLVLAEAMATGTPCLVPDFGVMPEVVKDGHTGMVYKDGNVDSLLAAITKLWETAPGMRSACRQHVESLCSPAVNLEMLDAMYARE